MIRVDLTILPTWCLLDFGTGVRVAGYAEQIDIGGVPFVAVAPHARESIKINAEQIRSILPCTEEYARTVSARQWSNTG